MAAVWTRRDESSITPVTETSWRLPSDESMWAGHSAICSSCKCAVSQALWNASDGRTSGEEHLPRTLDNVRKSADYCELCALIISSSPRIQKNWDWVSGDGRLNVEILFGGQRLLDGCLDYMTIRATFQDTGDLHHEGRFRVSSDQGSLLHHHVDKNYLDTDPLSQRTLQTINDWVETCAKDHPSCGWGSGLPTLPTRVIDVLSSEAILLETMERPSAVVKLIETDRTKGRYIALSHCWGHGGHENSEFTTTTRSSLTARKQSIPVQLLPKTFQDAIKVTKALSIRYLWIDSLCIVQDDLQDWEHEASQMAEVYSNAFLTIAAAHSKDDSEGFLDSRPHIHMPIEFQVGKNNLYVSKVKVEGAPFQTDIQLMDNEPLHKRAWTLQERYLSPRALHYTKYQMFWECNGGVTAERGDYSPRTCCFDSILYGDPDIEPPWFATWIELVERYSCRKLTVASDRLPALSGMASRLAGATGDRYCAGVWQSRILHGISWQKKWSPTNYKSEDILPGPSWSWASISDPILFHPRVIEERGEPYVAHAIVLNYDIEHEGENLYGAVRSGRLTIRGPVLKFDTSKGSLHLFYWDRDDEERYPCFVLLLWTQGTGNPLDSDCQARGFVGLILKPTSSDHREFQRVGLMAPGIGKLGKDIPYKAEDVRDIILV